MEMLGTIAGLVDFAIKLKGTFDTIGENRSHQQLLANNIVMSLQRIERIMNAHQEELLMAPDLQEPLGQLELELQTTLSKSERRFKSREGIGKFKTKFIEWKDGGDITKELTRLEQNVNTFYLHFLVDMTTTTTFNTTRMDVTMNNMQESLGRIAKRLQTDLLPAANKDQVLAEELVGTEELERPEIARAMEDAQKALKKAPEQSVEQEYLRLQIKTLRGRLETTTPREEKSNFILNVSKLGPGRSSGPAAFTPATQYINISEPLPQARDAVMECIRLLRRLETAKSATVSLQTVGELRDLSVALRALGLLTEAHDICLACVEMCRGLSSGSKQAQSVSFDLALSLMHLSSSANDIGERTEALDSVKEGVKLYRELAASRPNVYRSHLATALLRYSKRLNSAGRHEDALAKSTEGISIISQLVEVKKIFLPDLAKALIYHAYALLGTGRYVGSTDAIEQAVVISRQLAVESKDQYAPLYSKALNFQAICFYEQYRYNESVKAAREAVQIRRKLIEFRPEEFSYALADSLNNLSLSLGEMWQYDGALKTSKEAVEIARSRLAKEPSDPNKWLLVQSLQPLAEHLKGLDMLDESVKIARETITLIRSLAVDNEALRTDLSEALLNLGKGLTELGELKPALEALKESVEIRRILVESYQKLQLFLLAESLNWMGWCQMGLGEREAALASANESVDLFRSALATSDCPDAFRMGLVMALSLSSRCYRQVGRSYESLKPAREGSEMLASFPPQYPPLSVAYVSGTVLRAYSSALHDDHQYELALKKSRQSLEFRKKLPVQYAGDKSESLMQYAEALGECGHYEEAHQHGIEGITLIRPLSDSRPGIHRTSLAKALLKQCRIDANIEAYRPDCITLAEEAVELFRKQPEEFKLGVSEALYALALAYEREGKLREALGAAKESFELRESRKGFTGVHGIERWIRESKDLVARLEQASIRAAKLSPRPKLMELDNSTDSSIIKKSSSLPF